MQGLHWSNIIVRCSSCEIVVKYSPECFVDYGLCIVCAINRYPKRFTRRQKLKQRRKIIGAMTAIKSMFEKQKTFELLLIENKTVAQYKDWNKVK